MTTQCGYSGYSGYYLPHHHRRQYTLAIFILHSVMAMLPARRLFILSCLSLLVVPLAVILHADPPPGTSQPWRTRAAMLPFKLFAVVCDFLEPLLGPDIHYMVGRPVLQLTYWLKGLPKSHPQVKVENVTVDGVSVSIYRPPPSEGGGLQPAVIYIHGGGWVFGSVVGFDQQSHFLALGTGFIIVSVEYRRAPEFPFPTPFNDCHSVAVHLLDHAEQYGIDPQRIAISGDSAGGNLAAAVTIKLRDEKRKRPLALQVLIYPVLQAADFHTPSYQQHEHHAVVRKLIMVRCWLWYMFGDQRHHDAFFNNQHTSPAIKQQLSDGIMNINLLPADHFPHHYQHPPTDYGNHSLWEEVRERVMNPLLSPLLAPDLSRLPATYVLTVEQDILRDEGFWFVKRLKSAGVTTYHEHFIHSFHGGALLSDKLADSQKLLDGIINFIKTHL